jgi:tricorn protease
MRLKLALLLLVLAFSAHASEPFLRRPAIHGDTIAFTSEGDLWVASLPDGEARRLTTHDGTETSPRFSPDGARIAFAGEYDGGPDLYVIDTAGGVPRRLTWDNDPELRPVAWSADGRQIFFRSRRLNGEWHNRLWSIDVTGGLPKLQPVPRAEHAAIDPAGQRVAFVPISAEWQHWKRYRGGQADDVWLADLATKSFRRLTSEPSIETTPVWAAGQLFVASDRTGTSNLYRIDPEGGQATAVTTFTDDDLLYPSSDGRRIVFEHGNGLGLYDPASGAVTARLPVRLTSDRIHARPRRLAAKEHLQRAAIGPTGKRVLVASRGQIVSLPAGSEGPWRIVEATPGARAQYPAWSHDGKWIAFVSDRSGEEQVWLAPASGGAPARQLTKDHAGPLGPIVWSPDGKRLATSDREMRVLLVDVDSGRTTVVAQADRGGSYDTVVDSHRFSPDGKWLTYTVLEPTWYQSVWLYDITRGTRTRLTSPSMDSYSPVFDPSGKYLYFLSRRELRPAWSPQNQNIGFDKTSRVSVIALAADTKPPLLKLDDEEGIAPKKDEPAKKEESAAKSGKEGAAALPVVKVDLDGIADRIADVPVPGDRYAMIAVVEDRLLLAIDTEPSGAGGDPDRPHFQLRALPLKDPRKIELVTVVEKMTSFDVSADGKKLLVRAGKDLSVGASDAAPLKEPDSIPLDRVLLAVDPPAEWKQMFEETWRIARDFFYDPAMRGVDWPAVKKKYAAQLPNIGDRSELNVLLGNLVAELNTGHSYIAGGDLPRTQAPETGRLGADFEPDPSGKAWRIARILPGDPYDLENRSPLLAPGVNVKAGELVVSVDGHPVSTDRPVASMLVGAAGRLVPVGVSSAPTGAPVRVVLVRPIRSESRLRYYDWVAGRRQYVRTHGGDKIVYVHMPNMGDRGLEEFTKQYYPDIPDSDGVILDVRNNGGGWISANLLAQIADRPHTWFKPRYGASWTRASWATPGYRVAMCDDQSYSNAEEFCDAFQRMKLGPVVGSRSWGGEVGSGNGYPLLDGGLIFIPNYGAWSPADGWIIEGRGVVPDIEVEQDPASLLAGRDPQLDRAIAYIREQIAKKPVEHPVPPPHARGAEK